MITAHGIQLVCVEGTALSAASSRGTAHTSSKCTGAGNNWVRRGAGCNLHALGSQSKLLYAGAVATPGTLAFCPTPNKFGKKLLQFARILALEIIIIIIFQAQGAWQGSRWQAPERGGLRLPRQAEAGGTSHRHPVSGPRGCRALPLHFPRCSLGALRRIGTAMASGEAASA